MEPVNNAHNPWLEDNQSVPVGPVGRILGVVVLTALSPFILIHKFFRFLEKMGNWGFNQHLTLENYLNEHPHCKTQNGIQCFKCNSRSIKNWGFEHARDERRVFICNHCNTTLYRV